MLFARMLTNDSNYLFADQLHLTRRLANNLMVDDGLHEMEIPYQDVEFHTICVSDFSFKEIDMCVCVWKCTINHPEMREESVLLRFLQLVVFSQFNRATRGFCGV